MGARPGQKPSLKAIAAFRRKFREKKAARRAAWLLRNQTRTHCKEGHRLTPQNTRVVGGVRMCATCIKQKGIAARQKKKAEQQF